jgi:hypothetical protein
MAPYLKTNMNLGLTFDIFSPHSSVLTLSKIHGVGDVGFATHAGADGRNGKLEVRKLI